MSLNVPLLRKVVSWVLEQDQLAEVDRQWNQESWAVLDRGLLARLEATRDKLDPMCGTSMCAAGKIAQLEGWDFEFPNTDIAYEGIEYATKDGVTERISIIARDALGLEVDRYGDGPPLFDGSNSAKDIENIAKDLVLEYTNERL